MPTVVAKPPMISTASGGPPLLEVRTFSANGVKSPTTAGAVGMELSSRVTVAPPDFHTAANWLVEVIDESVSSVMRAMV